MEPRLGIDGAAAAATEEGGAHAQGHRRFCGYDTETAELLAAWEFGYPNDFSHVWEGLYRTAKGALFIAGKGGPRSKYARTDRTERDVQFIGIQPATKEEAVAWCEEHHKDGAIEKYFADAIADA